MSRYLCSNKRWDSSDLKSILIASKYNTGYLGLGFNYSTIGFLLITIFPWSPFFLGNIFPNFKTLAIPPDLSIFIQGWVWSNFLFLFFFFRQADFRTFVAFVPPLSIWIGARIVSILELGEKPSRAEIVWNILFLLVFAAAFIIIMNNPVNSNGIPISAAGLPIALFALSLANLSLFLFKPSNIKFVIFCSILIISYVSLFYNAKPLTDSFNQDLDWPKVIQTYRKNGYQFVVYRPHDRKLFYSPDLQYIDFIQGPADQYFWEPGKIRAAATRKKMIILSDTESWEKTKIKANIITQDDYSCLAVVKP